MSIDQTVTYARVVGQSLAWRRQLKGLDQSQLADAVGITQPTWSKMERGELAITIEQLAKAAAVLKCTPSDILRTADDGVAQLRVQGVRVVGSRADAAVSGPAALLGVAAVAFLIAGIMRK